MPILRVLSFAILLFQPFPHKLISSFGSSLLRGNIDIRDMSTKSKKSSSRNEASYCHSQPLGRGRKANHHFLGPLLANFPERERATPFGIQRGGSGRARKDDAEKAFAFTTERDQEVNLLCDVPDRKSVV